MTQASGGRLVRPHKAEDLANFTFGGSGWPMNKHGIFEDGRWAHLPLVYKVRTDPRIMRIFARLYGSGRHLVVSSDRVNYQLPSEWLPYARLSQVPEDPSNIARMEEATWLHVDQALDHHGTYCVQGCEQGRGCFDVAHIRIDSWL